MLPSFYGTTNKDPLTFIMDFWVYNKFIEKLYSHQKTSYSRTKINYIFSNRGRAIP